LGGEKEDGKSLRRTYPSEANGREPLFADCGEPAGQTSQPTSEMAMVRRRSIGLRLRNTGTCIRGGNLSTSRSDGRVGTISAHTMAERKVTIGALQKTSMPHDHIRFDAAARR
jgi:hypothetical protein